MVSEGHSLVFMDLGSTKQQAIRGMSINDMKTSSCYYKLDNQVKIDVLEREGSVTSKA